jgi:hypothetical protein
MILLPKPTANMAANVHQCVDAPPAVAMTFDKVIHWLDENHLRVLEYTESYDVASDEFRVKWYVCCCCDEPKEITVTDTAPWSVAGQAEETQMQRTAQVWSNFICAEIVSAYDLAHSRQSTPASPDQETAS